MRPRIPIDDCDHKFEYDEVAEEDYCVYCGLVIKDENEGWVEPNDIDL